MIFTLVDGSKLECQDERQRLGPYDFYVSVDKQYVVRIDVEPPDSNSLAKRLCLWERFQASSDVLKERCNHLVALVHSPGTGVVSRPHPSSFLMQGGRFPGRERSLNWLFRPQLQRMVKTESEHPTRAGRMRLLSDLARTFANLEEARISWPDVGCREVLASADSKRIRLNFFDEKMLTCPEFPVPECPRDQEYMPPEVAEGVCRNTEREAVQANRHALAILIYEMLMLRHPFNGPKVFSTESMEEDQRLMMGFGAVFIEHPTDHSNRWPGTLTPSYDSMGRRLQQLFERAFIKGIAAPEVRPGPLEWKSALDELTTASGE
ncbi:MAG: hypothetical protein R3C18_01930 [Planctomycetaceae bacterium]